MKIIPRQIAVTLFLLLLLAGASFAASVLPLNLPYGLAVDSKGNLYVANFSGNNILVYNPIYSQLTTKTITSNIDGPASLAFDPAGNLHVANLNGNSITEYSPSGAPIPTGTITNGVNGPQFIAVDQLGSIWVSNISSINVYAQTGELTKTLQLDSQMYGIGVTRGYTLIGISSGTLQEETLPLLVNSPIGFEWYGGGVSIACDNHGNCYRDDPSGLIFLTIPAARNSGPIFTVPFSPHGIAVDSTRKRLYISNPGANQIAVYDLQGNLLHTIQ